MFGFGTPTDFPQAGYVVAEPPQQQAQDTCMALNTLDLPTQRAFWAVYLADLTEACREWRVRALVWGMFQESDENKEQELEWAAQLPQGVYPVSYMLRIYTQLTAEKELAKCELQMVEERLRAHEMGDKHEEGYTADNERSPGNSNGELKRKRGDSGGSDSPDKATYQDDSTSQAKRVREI